MLTLARNWASVVIRGALAGVLSVAFAILIVFIPGLGAVAIIWAIGAYAIFFGVVRIGLGLRLRAVHRAATEALPPA